MKITRADLDFYQRKHLPAWANNLKRHASYGSIHACVNGHAVDPRSRLDIGREMAADNFCAILLSVRKRAPDLAAELLRIAKDPGTVINPKTRARYARRWAAKILRGRKKDGQTIELHSLAIRHLRRISAVGAQPKAQRFRID